MLSHQHEPRECRSAYAAWKGFESPLRRKETFGSCARGGHRLWWVVSADTADAALEQLPLYLAERTDVSEVSEVAIP
jgi:hypothetical protein